MVLKLLRSPAILAVVVAAAAWLASESQAFAQHRSVVSGDLFYNYYVPPDPYAGVGAQLYLSPRPTPPLVGHTYITYQPLMPHEFLYHHHRVYQRLNPDGSVTKVHVGWQ